MNRTLIPGRPVMVPAGVLSWLLWVLFGNADDGALGTPDFHPTRPAWLRRILWWLRNPAHNLMFYVLGCAHLEQCREGRYPLSVFAPEGGLNWAVSHVWMDKPLVRGHLFFLLLLGTYLGFLPFGSLWVAVVAGIGLHGLCLLRYIGWMPFVSWQGHRIKAYAGWRERGNFGLKFNLVRAR